MGTEHDRLEALDRHECLELLRHARLGRVGFTLRALPTIVPAGYCLENGTIFVRCAPESDLAASLNDAIVSFEVDHIDTSGDTGWCVVVVGRAQVLSSQMPESRLPRSGWSPFGDGAVLGISCDLVTGQRLDHDGARHEAVCSRL